MGVFKFVVLSLTDNKVPDLCGSPRLCFIASRKAQPLVESFKKEGQSSVEVGHYA